MIIVPLFCKCTDGRVAKILYTKRYYSSSIPLRAMMLKVSLTYAFRLLWGYNCKLSSAIKLLSFCTRRITFSQSLGLHSPNHKIWQLWTLQPMDHWKCAECALEFPSQSNTIKRIQKLCTWKTRAYKYTKNWMSDGEWPVPTGLWIIFNWKLLQVKMLVFPLAEPLSTHSFGSVKHYEMLLLNKDIWSGVPVMGGRRCRLWLELVGWAVHITGTAH